MRIDAKKILFSDFCTWADNKTREEVKAAIPASDARDWWQLTIGELGNISNGILPYEVGEDWSVYDYFSLSNSLETFVKSFVGMLNEYQVRETAEERQAAAGLPKFNENEGLLVFARRYFGLKSFTDAENVTLGDVYLAKKDEYIQSQFERNYNEIMTNKFKVKK